MNRILRRPMFRIGGTAEGITSGLAPRQGYATNEDNLVRPNDPSKYRSTRNFNDFLIGMGLDLVSRPKGGNIFQQVATSARGPFKEFQAARAAGEERDWKMGLHKEKMDFERDRFTYEQNRDVADRELQKYLGEIDARGKTQYIIEELDKHWDTKISAAEAEGKSEEDIAALEAQKAEDKYKALHGYDVSDTMAILRNTAAFEKASDLARGELYATINPATNAYWIRTDKGFADAVIELTQRYLRQIAAFLQEDKEEQEEKATGGRVGYQIGGDVMPGQPMQARAAATSSGTLASDKWNKMDTSEMDTGETNQVNISYEQLRERLPQEISNEIVLLLSQSYEAFADFAEIQTQADVNEFNTKYNVQLFLPKQSGA